VASQKQFDQCQVCLQRPRSCAASLQARFVDAHRLLSGAVRMHPPQGAVHLPLSEAGGYSHAERNAAPPVPAPRALLTIPNCSVVLLVTSLPQASALPPNPFGTPPIPPPIMLGRTLPTPAITPGTPPITPGTEPSWTTPCCIAPCCIAACCMI
jgi:hypothetical protein